MLDVGCSSGALGAALKAERPEVTVVGIEQDPGYAAQATERLDRVVTADAADLDGLDLGLFDCIVFADVLEHLVDPALVLRAAATRLEPGGRIVVSLPNVRYWETFWQLGRHGRWPRRSVGLFDRTHLRWFTLADAYDLLAEADLEPELVRRRLLRPDGLPWPRAVEALAARTPGARTLLALQNLRWFTLADAYDLLAEADLEAELVRRRLLRPDGLPWPRAVEALAARTPGARTLLALQNLLVAQRRRR